MKKLTTTLIFIIPTIAFSQKGPGGIGNTDGATALELWLDASTLSGADGDNITTWPDLSGNGFDATQNISGFEPKLQNSIVNGQNIVRFDGTDDRVNGNLNNPTNTPLTIIAVPFFDNINQAVDDNDYIFSMGNSGTSNPNEHVGIARRQANGGSNTNEYYSFDGNTTYFGPTLTGQQWSIITQIANNSAGFHTLFFDGASQVVDDYSGAITTPGNFSIGRWTGNTRSHLDGDIAEVLVFSKVLSTAELNIIHSYLGAKYNISVTTGGGKYESDPDDNDLNVAGVGTEADGSSTSANSLGLIVSINSNFENGDYVLFGHNDAINNLNYSDITLNTGTIEARWQRDWYVDVTDAGGALSADFVFDYSDAGLLGSPTGSTLNYKLLYRSGASGNWDDMGSATSISGDQITFSNNSIASDGYYTVATTDTFISPLEFTTHTNDGPGGIQSLSGSSIQTSSLTVWLDASMISGADEDDLAIWSDKSGNGNNAIQSTPGLEPKLQTLELNGNNTVRFDGVDNYMSGTLGGVTDAPITVIAVPYFAQATQGTNDNDYVVSIGEGLPLDDPIKHMGMARRTTGDDRLYCFNGTGSLFGSTLTGSTWYIISQTFDVSATYLSMYLDGATETVSADYTFAPSTNGNYSIGDWASHSSDGELNGDIAEVIIFNKVLNTAELNIAHAYLAAKYDLSVTNDQYTGDDAGNNDNDLDVFGIGTESDGSNTSGSGAGLSLTINTGFDNTEYIVAGHNNSTNEMTILDIGSASGTLEGRWERDWYLDVTGTGMTVDFSFDFSNAIPGGGKPQISSNYVLIHRTGISGDWTHVATASSIYGDQVNFSNISVTTDGYFTIASTSLAASPLPVDLISFSAKRLDSKVEIKWKTGSEVNNNRFEIEKSPDGQNWSLLKTVTGKGSTSESSAYSAFDESPYINSLTYYRLKQIDHDGEFKYYDPVSVDMPHKKTIDIYPNAVNNILKIEGAISSLSKLKVVNILGQDMTNLIDVTRRNHSLIEMELSSLTSGIYFIKTNIGTYRIAKK